MLFVKQWSYFSLTSVGFSLASFHLQSSRCMTSCRFVTVLGLWILNFKENLECKAADHFTILWYSFIHLVQPSFPWSSFSYSHMIFSNTSLKRIVDQPIITLHFITFVCNASSIPNCLCSSPMIFTFRTVYHFKRNKFASLDVHSEPNQDEMTSSTSRHES